MTRKSRQYIQRHVMCYKNGGGAGGGGSTGGGGGASESVTTAAPPTDAASRAILKGSEKQVKWAEDIRQKADWSTDGLTPRGKEIIDWVKKIDDAKWWIENRDLKTTKDVISALSAGTFINGKAHVLDQKTGKIVKKWSEIISDGKGGYKKQYEDVVF